MRILSHKEFLATPPGTVYAEGKPNVYGPWKIKTGNCSSNDWCYDVLDFQALDVESSGDYHDKMEAMTNDSKVSFPVEFHQTMRDGMFEDGALYAILEPQDVRALIARLQETL